MADDFCKFFDSMMEKYTLFNPVFHVKQLPIRL